VESAIYLPVVMVVGTELKIFNSVRIQISWKSRNGCWLQARHGRFANKSTRTSFQYADSISSLVRFDPDTAREMILKLATISAAAAQYGFVCPAAREVEFIDNYLDIEVVRFGRDKLKVVRISIRRLSKPWFPACCCSRCRKLHQARTFPKVEAQHYAAQPSDQITTCGRGGR